MRTMELEKGWLRDWWEGGDIGRLTDQTREVIKEMRDLAGALIVEFNEDRTVPVEQVRAHYNSLLDELASNLQLLDQMEELARQMHGGSE